jgi:hypothetical protein
MPRITISYRRDDSLDVTGRIFDRLAGHFGREAVFRDIESIPLGVDFRRHIDRTLDESDVVLAIVGPRWIGSDNRLESPADPVRLEIETALRKDKPLIPVLVSRAVMPHPDVLPASIHDFVYRNAVQVDSGQDFDVHVARLIRAIERILRIDEGRTPDKAVQGAPPMEPTSKAESPVDLVAAPVTVVVSKDGAKDVFVSFCNEDETAANEIVGILEGTGIACWIANRDVWQNYQEEIVDAIKAAKAMVIVFSANANRSDEIKKELSLAGRYKLSKIPVRIEDAAPQGAFEYEFSTSQYIDLFKNRESGIGRLTQAIRRVI